VPNLLSIPPTPNRESPRLLHGLHPDNAVFVTLAFEGPDIYSQAGGLGVRVTELSRMLAQLGFDSHLFFVGDPSKAAQEIGERGHWILHRWCQWLSAYFPDSVYQGEREKVAEFRHSLPSRLVEDLVRPAALAGRLTVVLAEEWHTVDTVIALDEQLREAGLREQCVIFWNANNTFGFQHIDWDTLQAAATLTTVSRYMKHKMRLLGVDPLIIPNGIPERLLHAPPTDWVRRLREVFPEGPLLAKVGRYDPDKRWLMAIDTLHRLKEMGRNPHMLVRGGIEPHREELLEHAHGLGLTWANVKVSGHKFDEILEALRQHRYADILELHFFVPEELLRTIYAAADAVLANSGHEPFGLVGLEVMATGGIAFTGATGEEYAQSFHNAVVVDSDNALEMAVYITSLQHHQAERDRIRANAFETARHFTWNEVIKELLRKVEFTALMEGTPIEMPGRVGAPLWMRPPVHDRAEHPAAHDRAGHPAPP
jgi:glycosyltransferase involved in cell wall biosynthesis